MEQLVAPLVGEVLDRVGGACGGQPADAEYLDHPAQLSRQPLPYTHRGFGVPIKEVREVYSGKAA